MAMAMFNCRANCPDAGRQAVGCFRAVAVRPTAWAGRWWRTVRKRAVRCQRWSTAVGADDTPGQCDSSVGPAPAGPMTPSAKEPPMGYADPAIAQRRNNSTNAFDNCTFVNQRANCELRYFR